METTFIPIQNLIISYINLHEFYIEELKNKTIQINDQILRYRVTDCGYGSSIMINCYNNWGIRCNDLDYYRKYDIIKKLNERISQRDKIFGIIKTDIYGYGCGMRMKATNRCYINY